MVMLVVNCKSCNISVSGPGWDFLLNRDHPSRFTVRSWSAIFSRPDLTKCKFVFTQGSVGMVCALWCCLPKKGDTKLLLRPAVRCWSVLEMIVMVAEWLCESHVQFEVQKSRLKPIR